VKRTATLLLLALTAPLVAQEGDRARTEALARRAGERLQALHQEADRLAAETRTLLGDLRRLDLERQIKTEELHALDVEVVAVAGELDALNQEVARLEQQEAKERPELRARLVELYKLGQGRYLRLLLSTSEARHVMPASRMVAVLARRDRDRLAAHQQRKEQIAAARLTLEERETRLAALRVDAEEAQVAAARAVEARDALIRDIDRQRDLNAQLTGELQQVQQRLQLTLRDLAAGGPAAEPPALPLPPFRGALDWPLEGTLRHRFGQPAAGHASPNGIDIAAAEGAAVQAIHGGRVVFADTFAGFGKLVIVDHGGQNFSLYGHLLEIDVARDAAVERGQAVGSVGSAPRGAAGLYFELRVDGKPVDPLQWLKKR